LFCWRSRKGMYFSLFLPPEVSRCSDMVAAQLHQQMATGLLLGCVL
jgi:hypothetical protein